MARRTLDDTVEQFNLKREHGNNLAATMGNLMFPTLSVCVEELVSNSYDNDATRVDIAYNPKRGILTITDNGTGMDRKGLEAFYRMGDSEKLENPISPKGRQRIGRFGIATLAIRRLANHYKLTTSDGKSHHFVEESVTRDDKDSKKIRVQKRKTKIKPGTKIVMDELKFTRTDGRLSMTQLHKDLAVELPIGPDFQIYINKRLVHPIQVPKNAVEYVIDVHDEIVGHIHGTIYYARRLPKDTAGMYIKVRGRAVGGSYSDITKNLKFGMMKKLFGVIHADGLDDIVGFDRTKFIDDPRLDQVLAHIKEVARQITNDMSMERKNERFEQAAAKLDKASKEVGRIVGLLLGQTTYNIVFDEKQAGAVARIDRKNRLLYINHNSAAVRMTGFGNREVRQALMNGFIYAFAAEHMEGNSTEAYQKIFERIPSAVRGDTAHKLSRLVVPAEQVKQSISEARMYTFRDAAAATGYDNSILTRLVAAGLIEPREDEKIRGKQLIDANRKMKGARPLRQIINDHVADVTIRQGKEKTAHKKLAEMVTYPSFIQDISETEAPFYVVSQGAIPAVKKWIDTWKFEAAKERVFSTAAYGKHNKTDMIVYAMEVPDGEEADYFYDDIQALTEDEGEVPYGIKHNASFARHNGSSYLLGTVTCEFDGGFDKLYAWMEKGGFVPLDLGKRPVTPMYKAVKAQRSEILPLTTPKKFTGPKEAVLTSMLSYMEE